MLPKPSATRFSVYENIYKYEGLSVLLSSHITQIHGKSTQNNILRTQPTDQSKMKLSIFAKLVGFIGLAAAQTGCENQYVHGNTHPSASNPHHADTICAQSRSRSWHWELLLLFFYWYATQAAALTHTVSLVYIFD